MSPPEVIHRAMPAPEHRRMTNGARDVLLHLRDGLLELMPQRQMRGHRGSEGTPGAVRAESGDPFRLELREAVTVVEQIEDVGGRQVTALDDHARGSQGDKAARGLAPRFRIVNPEARERLGLSGRSARRAR